ALPSPAREPVDVAGLRDAALALVNAARQEHGLAPLKRAAELDAAAQRHAEDMLQRGYYGHLSPEGGDAMDRYLAEGGSRGHRVHENIARCSGCPMPPSAATVRRFHLDWMESPPHRASILAGGIERYGFGLAAAGGTVYAVEMFAGVGTGQGQGAGAEPAPVPAEDLQRQALGLVNWARRAAAMPPLQPSDALTEAARSLMPRTPGAEPDLDPAGGLRSAVPEPERSQWRSLSAVAASCGGCGRQPTAGDVGAFIGDQWLR